MRLYIKRKKGNIDAVAEYDFMAKRFVVLSGSKVSDEISYSEKFRGSIYCGKLCMWVKHQWSDCVER